MIKGVADHILISTLPHNPCFPPAKRYGISRVLQENLCCPTHQSVLNKYISESGICSRREADRYIEQGNVFLNGKRATIGDQVKPGDVVKVNGQLIEPRERRFWYLSPEQGPSVLPAPTGRWRAR